MPHEHVSNDLAIVYQGDSPIPTHQKSTDLAVVNAKSLRPSTMNKIDAIVARFSDTKPLFFNKCSFEFTVPQMTGNAESDALSARDTQTPSRTSIGHRQPGLPFERAVRCSFEPSRDLVSSFGASSQQFVLRLENTLRDFKPASIEFETQLGDVFQMAGDLSFVGIAGELLRDTFQILRFCFKVRDGDSKNLQELSSFVHWD
jgi:hypothetical protein